MENQNLQNNEEALKSEFLNVSTEIGEIALDSILTDGIFKDLPLIGPLISSVKFCKSASDYLLLRRLLIFINTLDFQSENEIKIFKEKYFKIEDYQRIGAKILFAIEKADNELKIEWLSKSLNLLIDRKINANEFLRITSIINSSFPSDAEKISVFNKRERITSTNDLIDKHVLDHLYSIGLLSTGGFDGGDAAGKNAGTVFILNKFGKLFLEKYLEE